ncbi:MAG: FAD-dependent oxidoreductase [Candidatus Nanohaloarchaea archaeon]|nr:FAD-dependent oxidoreductase [Candidatus Nanohaloarchaea archaeon]
MTQDASLRSIHQMTPTVKQFQLELEEGTWEFQPGQHTVIHFEQDGEEVARPYTPTSRPGTDTFTLAIKRYDDGTASVYMHEREPGDVIEVEEPDGNLYVRDYDSDVVFVSTGTGITPMVAMLKDYLDNGTGDAYFFFGEKTQDHLMYRETLDQLEAEHDNLTVVYSLSDEDWSGREGFVQEHIDDVLTEITSYDYYISGVPKMVVQTENLLAENDVPDDRIYSEGWESDVVGD